MTRRDVSNHLTLSPAHREFEALVEASYGAGELRRMVASHRVARAWAAAAADRVARGRAPVDVVAALGDLGTFCVALGSLSVLGAVPQAVREAVHESTDHSAPGAWLADDMLHEGHVAMAWTRDALEVADAATLRAWTATYLPLVVEVFARQAPRWWRVRRAWFARFVLVRLAVPGS